MNTFTARELYNHLIKGVFGTYTFHAEDGSLPFDRAYFFYHRISKPLFSVKTNQYIIKLYELAFNDRLRVSKETVSYNLNNLFITRFNIDYQKYVINNDNKITRQTKISFWLDRVEKICKLCSNLSGDDIVALPKAKWFAQKSSKSSKTVIVKDMYITEYPKDQIKVATQADKALSDHAKANRPVMLSDFAERNTAIHNYANAKVLTIDNGNAEVLQGKNIGDALEKQGPERMDVQSRYDSDKLSLDDLGKIVNIWDGYGYFGPAEIVAIKPKGAILRTSDGTRYYKEKGANTVTIYEETDNKTTSPSPAASETDPVEDSPVTESLETSTIDIPADEFYRKLVFEVFKNKLDQESYWVRRPKDIGRTYFRDHVKVKKIFDSKCIEKLIALFDCGFNGNLISAKEEMISQNLKELFKEYFLDDFSFLMINEIDIKNDDKKLLDAKIRCWSTLLNKLFNSIQGKNKDDSIKTNYRLFGAEYETIKNEIKPLADPITMEHIKRIEGTQEPKIEINTADQDKNEDDEWRKVTPSTAKSKADPLADMSVEQTGAGHLYFLDYILMDINSFIADYKKSSLLNLCTFPVLEERPKDAIEARVTMEKWMAEVDNDRIYPLYIKEPDLFKGYDIAAIKNDKNNNTYYTSGRLDMYLKLKNFLPDTKLIVILPDDLRKRYNELENKYFDNGAPLMFYNYFKKDIEQFLFNEDIFPYFIRMSSSNLHYYAGLIDGIASMNLTTVTNKNSFTDEYRRFIKKIEAET